MKKFYAFAAAAMAAVSMNAQSLYVCGSGEGLGWDPAAPLEVEQAAGVYTMEINDLTSIKISTGMGDWDAFNAGALFVSLDKTNVGQALEVVNGEGNMLTPWKGDWKIVVAGDLSTMTFTTTTPEPTGATPVFLRGAMNGWGADELWQMTSVSDNKYTFECKGETMIPSGTMFKIADADWGAINYGAGEGTTIYVESEPEEGENCYEAVWVYNVEGGTTEDDFEGTIEISWESAQGDATVIMNLEGMGSIKDITVDANAPKTYYNLQGVEVANPAAGLYIVRQGNKVAKEIVK